MPAILKGSIQYKLDRDIKAGEVLELSGVEFTADQEDFERSLRGRLDQQQRKHEAEKADLQKQLDGLKTAQPDEKASAEAKQMAERLAKLESDLAGERLKNRIEAQLKALKLTDLPDAYRRMIDAKPDATDEELAAAVKAAGESFGQLKASLGGAPNPNPDQDLSLGNPGGVGSGDKSRKQFDELRDRVQRTRPDLLPMLQNMDQSQQLDVMRAWDSQGDLKPKA